MSNLKAKLDAAAAAQKDQLADQAASRAKYHQTVLREYPRLANELLAMVRAAVDGADGVTINVQEVPETISYQEGSTATGMQTVTVGTVKMPHWEVTFFGKRVSFRPAGTGYFGAHAKIEVKTSERTNPFGKNEGVFMSNDQKDPATWFLVVQDSSQRNRSVRLTQELLQELLEQVLLPSQ